MDEQPKITEHLIEPAKIAEFKKKYPVLKFVKIKLDKDDGSQETWELIFTKPSPLVFKKSTNSAVADDVYTAAATLVLGTCLFPSQDVIRKLIEEDPSLAIKINGELADIMSSVTEISSKKV